MLDQHRLHPDRGISDVWWVQGGMPGRASRRVLELECHTWRPVQVR
jgi:hypothetical protein